MTTTRSGRPPGVFHSRPRSRFALVIVGIMVNEMTKAWLKAHCKENGGYGTPELNDKLYLHFKGFDKIENLEEYTGLKSVFLEGNGLEQLTGLEACTSLRCLFAQQNFVREIPDALPASLSTINVSNNPLGTLEHLSRLPDLQTLQASHCELKDLDAIRDLVDCPELTTVDLQQNKIDGDAEEMVRLFASMPKLACLYLPGNPIVSSLRHYRKRMISEIPGLAYLDDRPVFPLERLCAEAWAKGGLEAEKAARAAHKAEEEDKQRRDREYLTSIREAARAKREEQARETRVALEAVGLSDASDGEWEEDPEPPELIAARAKLAMYEARPGEEEPPELTRARIDLAVEREARGESPAATRPWAPLAERDEVEGGGESFVTNATVVGESKSAGRALEDEVEAGERRRDENVEPRGGGVKKTEDGSGAVGSQGDRETLLDDLD